MNGHKSLLFEYFSDVFEGVRNIAIISMPDHQNKVSSRLVPMVNVHSLVQAARVARARAASSTKAQLDATKLTLPSPHARVPTG